mgnify:FL=1
MGDGGCSWHYPAATRAQTVDFRLPRGRKWVPLEEQRSGIGKREGLSGRLIDGLVVRHESWVSDHGGQNLKEKHLSDRHAELPVKQLRSY